MIIAIAFCVDVAHNTRGAEVTLYNTAVAEWEKAPSPATTLAETHGYEFVGDEAGKHSITPAFSSAVRHSNTQFTTKEATQFHLVFWGVA